METNRTVVGVDTAKRVFQLHWIDRETGEIVDLKLTRAKFLKHFATRAPCVVAMEACGGSQHWARELRSLGHEPRLLPAKAVRPFVAGNKNDVQDARAIWTAVQLPIALWHRSSPDSRRIAEIPGVGVLTATAVVAAMGDPAAFRSGREFAAWLGLAPRHTGTGGRVRMLGISKRGDKYLRTLLIHGARAVLTRSKAPPEWALRLATRRPPNVVTVAMANKTARTIWALLAHDRAYQANFVSRPA